MLLLLKSTGNSSAIDGWRRIGSDRGESREHELHGLVSAS